MVDNNLLIKDFTPEQAREAEEKQRMTQEAALKGLTDPRVKQYKRGRGGGARSLSTAERQRLAQQALEKLAQEEEAKSIQRSIAKQKAEERAVELEQARIEKLTQRLAKEGSTRTETFVNRATGDKIQHTITTRTGGERVFTRTNLKTGEITTKTFERGEGGSGGVQQSGGIISIPQEGFSEKLDTEGFSEKLDTEGLSDNRTGFQQAVTQGLGGKVSYVKDKIESTLSSTYSKLPTLITKPIDFYKKAQTTIKEKGVVGTPIFSPDINAKFLSIGLEKTGFDVSPKQESKFALGFAVGIPTTEVGTSKIAFLGKEQRVLTSGKDTLVRTDLIFKTSKTGEVGVARGLTLVEPIKDSLQSGKTIVVGKFGKEVFDPTKSLSGGGLVIKDVTKFGGVQKSLAREADITKSVSTFGKGNTLSEIEKGTEQVGKGFVVRGKKLDRFYSEGISLSKEDLSFIKGTSLVGKGEIVKSAGLIGKVKDVSITTKSIGSIGGKVTKLTTPKLEQALISTQAVVSASVGSGTQTFSKLTGTTGTLKLPSITKTPTTQQVKQTQSVTQSLYTTQRIKQTPVTLPKTSQSFAQSQASGLKLKTYSVFKQAQRQRESQKLKRVQSQRSIRGFVSFPTIPKTPPPTPTLRLYFGKKKVKKKPLGLFTVSVRRGGKFKTIGTGLSLPKAFEVGRERVAGTLAATFKLSGKGVSTLKLPKGFSRGKQPLTFIEQRGLRLSRRGETKEIQYAKWGRR